MIDIIKREVAKNGNKAEVVPIERLQDLKQDIEELKNSGLHNAFLNFIVNDIYMLDLPDVDFEIHSIMIVASPSPFVKVIFNWKGEKIPLTIPPTYIDYVSHPVSIEQQLNDFLFPEGYHVKYASRLPRKLLAARSGLGVYGRNNLCYVEGMGSFVNLAPYFSDIPWTEANWHEIRSMNACKNCKACLNNCPTAAITNERFLIKADRCLTNFNESGRTGDFPEWIQPSSHNCIYGCLKCQTVCPKNAEYLENTVEPVEFDEEETQILTAGKPREQFPERLVSKVKKLDMFDYLDVLPRNLKVLFKQK